MTKDEVMAMTDEQLDRTAMDILGLGGETFPFSLHITAALELAEHRMRKGNGWGFTLVAERDDSGWAATFDNLAGKVFRATGDVVREKIRYSSPARAIVRAFILSMTEDEGD